MSTISHDPVTFDIIQNGLEAVADEMFAAQRKTSMSAIIYEVLDLGTGICDAQGEIAASGAGIPAFVGVLDKAVKRMIEKHPVETIKPGDLFASNDPYWGGVTHLNDMILAMPVFADGKIVAWTANIAHWNDVGGNVPGSMSSEATEIYQEGIRIPAVKLIDAGVPNQAVFDILYVNTRLPDFLRGDLWAGIAGVRIGEKRILEMIEKYGSETFTAAIADFMDLGERRARAALATIKKGVYPFEEEQDNGDIHKIVVEITDDAFIIDLRDNPDQKGSSNSSREGIEISAQLAFKAFTDTQAPGNGGFFRPLQLLTRPGSVFHVVEPGALGYYSEVEIRVFDLILRCLAHHFPGVLPAGNFASICGTVIGGKHPDTGRHYTIVEPQLGGWGAQQGRDGNSAIFSGFHGDTFNCPAEVAEARYGLTVDELALNTDKGGDGTWRGGKGISVRYRVRADDNFLSVGYTRSRIPPWGQNGGNDGSPNYVEVLRPGMEVERYAFATNVPLSKNDVVHVVTGVGGGFGRPADRSEAAVRRDFKNGYIDAETAARVYNVTI
ncbi:hydantoinase B/oxoprolinase family protein (plasmid) [Devosia neptuniae]|jgi:N-methylhydantoinase B|uniref:Hydantoinase B/oxoprolinase family protein n=1 Tax=Devosia neptuniae TaxID=191302 RepID=A0ABY6CAJ4_9HYPH|nr:hydantoinase B/oxoprolinase family protein [Devosia neptuniae]UXN68097.1 hydantoinase B/oxoprolinase family protein [Devosia neptuniae]